MSERVIEACEALLRLEAEHDGFAGSLPGDFGPKLARAYLDLAAVVAAQREALREWVLLAEGGGYGGSLMRRTRAALDAEGMSEPGESPSTEVATAVEARPSPGSLTSPVDTAPRWPVSPSVVDLATTTESYDLPPVDTARRLRKHGPQGWWYVP